MLNLIEAPKADLYWLAGLIEGEGCFTISMLNYPRFYLSMTDKDIIHKASFIIGCDFGSKAEQSDTLRGTTSKAQHTIQFSGGKAIQMMLIMYPLMGNRRRARIKEILTAWYNRPRERKYRSNDDFTEPVRKLIEEIH